MTICGWCHGTGTNNGKRCDCTPARRPHFARKPAKKAEFVIPSVHHHKYDVISSNAHFERWLCADCGDTKKIYVD